MQTSQHNDSTFLNTKRFKPSPVAIKNAAAKTYRIVDASNCIVEGLTGLNLFQAEKSLLRCLNLDVDAYIQDEKSYTEIYQDMNLSLDDVYKLIDIGFCQSRFYTKETWSKAKALMEQIVVPLGFATAHDFGPGFGKFVTNFDIDYVKESIANFICAD